MRRAALALVSTIAGLVLLLGFKTHNPIAAGGTSAALAPATPGAPTSDPSGAETSGSAASPASSGGTRTVTGQAYDTRYGPVQVQVSLSNGRVSDVTTVQLPDGNPRDREINDYAVPQLRSEALSAQSAHIDMVSGATYTSQGYIASLQSALDKVGG